MESGPMVAVRCGVIGLWLRLLRLLVVRGRGPWVAIFGGRSKNMVERVRAADLKGGWRTNIIEHQIFILQNIATRTCENRR
jgi:hypothetical protein